MERDEHLELVAQETLKKIVDNNPVSKLDDIKVFVDYSKEQPDIKLVVPGSFRAITYSMFAYIKTINTVDIQEGVNNIMSSAFDTCDHIKEVHLPDTLYRLNDFTFTTCINLEKINMPKNLKEIGSGVFFQCSNLKEINLPDGLETIDISAFSNCKRLEKIELPDSITHLHSRVFQNCVRLKEVKLSNNLQCIDSGCFYRCLELEEIAIPDSVKEIGSFAFEDCVKLKHIKLSKNIERIKSGAFTGCAIKEIVLPSSIKELERSLSECVNLEQVKYEYEDGKYFILPKEMYEYGLCEDDFRGLKKFLQVRDKIKAKFIPAKQIFANTPDNMIVNFYQHSKLWADILNQFAQSNNTTTKAIFPQVKEDFYKVCLVSGLFSDNYKERMRAKEFIETKIIGKFGQLPIHQRFTGLDTYSNGYNPMFAEFFIKNFGPDFLIKESLDDFKDINFFAQAYNNFADVQKTYPNKVVTTNTINDLLTEEDVYNVISTKVYSGIKTEKDQALANLCNSYGYSQEDFKKLQDYIHEGEKIKNEGLENLFCLPDEIKNNEVVTYRLLEKGDPLGGLLGEITNCCQNIHGAAASCCKHGMTDPNGGFVVFEIDGKIIGQSWVWYDEQSGKICLDNVEVPRSAKYKANQDKSDFKDCLKRLSNNFKIAMKEKGKNVSIVTMGKGYNDILEVVNDNFKTLNANYALATAAIQTAGCQTMLQGHSPVGVYTDTKQGEYILE